MKDTIELGDKVKCIYTGFVGIAIYKTEFVNGCIQFGVAPRIGKDNKVRDEVGIDSESLVLVSKKKESKEVERNGGANTKGMNMRGF